MANYCAHQYKVTVTVLDGVNHIFQSISSIDGHKIYVVCSQCHQDKRKFIGLPTEAREKRSGYVILDVNNRDHFSMLLNHLHTPYFERNDGKIEMPKGCFESVAGLEHTKSQSEYIVIKPTRCKKRQRGGIVADLIVNQTKFRVKDNELNAAKIAIADQEMKKRRYKRKHFDEEIEQQFPIADSITKIETDNN